VGNTDGVADIEDVQRGASGSIGRRRPFRVAVALLVVSLTGVLSLALTADVASARRRRTPTTTTLPAPSAPVVTAPPVEAAPVDVPADPAPPAEVPAEAAPPAPAPAPAPPVTSGKQPVLFWASSWDLDRVVGAVGPQNLDSLQQGGIGGYVSMTGAIEGFGGTPIPDWMVAEWRYITARGQQIYPAVYASSSTSPFADLFDDGQWGAVRAGLSNLAGRAREAGASGLGLDLENYGVSQAMWTVNYPGNTHDEATTRAKMFQRGQELAPIFASVGNLLVYSSSIAAAPGSYQDAVQSYVGNQNHYSDNLFPDFIRGLLAGGARVTVIDSVFAGGIQLPNRSWDTAVAESVGLMESLFPGVDASIMLWPENGSSSPGAAAVGSRLSTGPVVIYNQHLIDGAYDYGPYLAGLRAALG
jgi:hypothetical protein